MLLLLSGALNTGLTAWIADAQAGRVLLPQYLTAGVIFLPSADDNLTRCPSIPIASGW
jgi:hypothetical protein